MAVTIKELAALAGVSRGTVDRVLHNRPNVHPLVRERVLNVMRQSGYQPPDRLRQAADCRTVALLAQPWTDPYFNRQLSLGISRAQRYVNDPLVRFEEVRLPSRSSADLLQAVAEQERAGAAGLILRPENTDSMRAVIDGLYRRGIAVVTYDADLPGSRRICHAGQDLLRSGAVAAGLMARQMGPRDRVLMITGDLRLEAHKGRVNGFCRRLQELGFPPDSYVLDECFELPELTAETVRRRLDGDPRIRLIYMATQSVPGCVAGIRASSRAGRPPFVVCNDLTPRARKYLLSGQVDYVIGQAFDQESFYACLALDRYLRTGKLPAKEIYYTDLSIISKEML